MTAKRITAGILSVALLALFIWCMVAGVGDVRTRIMLAIGASIGTLYAVFGQLPEWIIDLGGDSLTDDDAPSNIPIWTYLPILLGVIAVAVVTFVFVVFIL